MRDWFSRSADTEEVALLSTCHRIELTLVARSPEALEQWRAVLPGGRESWRLREDVTLVHHLFRVAAGRESLAVGEAEVGQQVRIAGRSVESRHPRALLRELFRAAADAAQEVAPAPRNAPSIAAVAAARLREIVTAPTPHVVVVGSGTVGHQVVESLSSSTRLTVVYHQRPPEEAFLRSHGARAVPLERLPEALGGADAVITAAKFGNHGLRAADLPRDRPLLLVDLGMPRNIDPDVRTLPNVRLLDLEELHEQPRGSLDIAGGDLRLEELAQEFADRLAPLLLEPWIRRLPPGRGGVTSGRARERAIVPRGARPGTGARSRTPHATPRRSPPRRSDRAAALAPDRPRRGASAPVGGRPAESAPRRPVTERVRVGTRRSPLARAQTDAVVARLGRLAPSWKFEVVAVETSGDRDRSLGGSPDFTDAIDRALLRGEVDLAVHSAKDLPADLDRGLELVACPRRADARDCLILGRGDGATGLVRGARVGSSSLRRRAQLLRWRPDLTVVEIRGNVDSRIGLVRSDALDAAILAVAGVSRLGRASEISQVLPASAFLPAPRKERSPSWTGRATRPSPR